METFRSRLQGIVILVMIGLFIFFAAKTVTSASRFEKQIVVEKSQQTEQKTVKAEAPTAAPATVEQ